MNQPRVYEVQYSEFSTNLRNATNSKKKIEKPNIPEPAMWSRGKAGTLSGKVVGVIIDGAGTSDGYYV